jgi:single-strand DNA-binding protein
MAGRSLNKVMLIGRLGKDPEMRYTPNGNAVTNFRLACSRTWTVDGESREETEWVPIVVWGKLAENTAQYVKKGQQVYVEGRLQTRSWEGQDGQKRYTTEVVASEIIFLGSKSQEPVAAGFDDDDATPDVDDLPF